MSPTSTRTTAALLVIGALICGIVLGVAGDRAWMTWRARHTEAIANRIVKHLDRELHFTPQQRAAVQQIVDRHRQRVDVILASVRPQIRQEIDATNAEIDRLLTPEQRDKFAKMKMRMLGHERRGMRHGPM